MVIQSVKCAHCDSESLIRNGLTRNGKQGYKCKSCGRQSREGAQYERYSPAQKEQVLRAYNERPSMRGIQRIFGVSRPTLIDWLKKGP
jgi:transposase-like protein